jgi:hypothetical protein
MAGRTADISTSSFKPLSLDEIMMVPLALQKQEDAALAEGAKYDALKADVLGVDSEAAQKRIQDIQAQASGISDDIINNGVSRGQFQKLRKLKGETAEEMSTGFVGSAVANKKKAAQFIADLATKKERQAGWSPQQAQQWAQAQVSGFKGTMGADGSINSFAGQEMSMKVDEDKHIKDVIASVAERVDPAALQAVQIGGLPQFQRAFQDGEVKRKDYNTIMQALLTSSQTNPDLQASLKQQAFFTGEKNPTDMGKMNYTEEFVLDSKGEKVIDKKTGEPMTKTVRSFEIGNSRFGRKMAGAGVAGQYNNRTVNTKFLKDELAFQMYKDGMAEKSAIDLISFNRGEMTNISPARLEKVQEDLELYGERAKDYKSSADARRKSLVDGGMSLEEANSDVEVMRLSKLYKDSTVSYDNSKNRIDAIYSKVDGMVSTEDKKIIETEKLLKEYGGDWVKLLDEKWGKTVSDEWVGKSLGRTKEQGAYIAVAKEMGIDMSKAGRGRSGINFSSMYEGAVSRRDDITENYLEANPKAEYFTRLNGESTGKFATEIGRWNTLQSSKFAAPGQTLGYGNGMLETHPDFEDITEGLPEGETPQYQVEATDGYDDQGDAFNNVIVTTSKGTASFQVVDNMNNSAKRSLANQLLRGDLQHQEMGTQMLADLSFMKPIKKAGIGSQNEGSFRVNIGGYDKTVKFIKEPGTEAYNVMLIGKDNNGNSVSIPIGDRLLYGEKDISKALYAEQSKIAEALEKKKLNQTGQ